MSWNEVKRRPKPEAVQAVLECGVPVLSQELKKWDPDYKLALLFSPFDVDFAVSVL